MFHSYVSHYQRVPPMYKVYVREYPHKISPNIWYLNLRYLNLRYLNLRYLNWGILLYLWVNTYCGSSCRWHQMFWAADIG